MPSPITKRVSSASGKVSWTVQVRIGTGGNGRAKWLTKTFARQRDAKRYLTQVRKDRDDGVVVEPSRMILNAFLDKWLEAAVKPRVRTNTYRSYAWQLRKYLRDDLGPIRLCDLNPLQIQRLYTTHIGRGLSPRIVRYTHTILNNAMSQAVKWRLLTTNPCSAVELPRDRHKEARFLSAVDAARFVNALRGNRHEALFILALTSGMRPSEYLALRWSDIDFNNATVRVRRTLEWRSRESWNFSEPKTPKSRRSIPVPVETMALLQHHRRTQAEARLKAGSTWDDLDLVFTNNRGQPLDRQNLLRRGFRPLLPKAGLSKECNLYTLRHSCASLLLEGGVHPKIVSERLGHATTTLTMDVYSHISPNLQLEAARRIGEVVFIRPGG